MSKENKALPSPTATALPQARSREVYQAGRAAIATPSAADVSPECEKTWQALRATDLSRFSPSDAAPHFEAIGRHCAKVPARFANTQGELLERCRLFLESAKGDLDSPAYRTSRLGCHASLVVYRAQITDWLTRDEPIDRITDPKILADKTVARYVENPGAAADIADRLLELEPTLYPAAKLALYGRFLDARAHGQSPEHWAKMEEARKRAGQMNPQERSQHLEMAVAGEISRSRDPEKVEKQAKWLMENDAKSGYGHFWMAWAAQEKGDRAAMLLHLEKAHAENPNEAKFENALKVARQTPPGQKAGVFGMNLSIPLDSITPQ